MTARLPAVAAVAVAAALLAGPDLSGLALTGIALTGIALTGGGAVLSAARRDRTGSRGLLARTGGLLTRAGGLLTRAGGLLPGPRLLRRTLHRHLLAARGRRRPPLRLARSFRAERATFGPAPIRLLF
jgi:hypothetical protein